MIKRDDVLVARGRINAHIRHTPSLRPEARAEPLWLKVSFCSIAGGLKREVPFNCLLAARDRGELNPSVDVVVATGGNAGLANAYAAAALGIRAKCSCPRRHRQSRSNESGSTGPTCDRWAPSMPRRWRRRLTTPASTEPSSTTPTTSLRSRRVPAPAEEILEDEPDIQTIIVAVGGGGLYAGVTAATEGRARVVAVEPFSCPTLHAALDAGHPVDVPVSGVAADSLGARRVGEIAFSIASRVNPTSILVDDEAMVSARLQLWREYRIPAEHGAAAALASPGARRLPARPGGTGAVVVCGANTDVRTLEPE